MSPADEAPMEEIRMQFEAHLRSLPTYRAGQLTMRRDGHYSRIEVDCWFTGFVMAVNSGAA